jgi:GrpB-like predicted nucleotidyltransferase (UPF0157 family)
MIHRSPGEIAVSTTQPTRSQQVEIIPYRESWPEEFRVIGTTLRRTLGRLALRIDHIGSTSVPGLAAKDVIDIQVTVSSLKPVERIDQTLALAGYMRYAGIVEDHRPPGADGPNEEWHKLLFRPPPAQRPTHLHVRARQRANQRYALLCRDYLRTHPAVAAAYVAFKKRVVKYHGDDRLAYVDIKDPVFDIIVGAAEEWVEEVDWAPGRSDA